MLNHVSKRDTARCLLMVHIRLLRDVKIDNKNISNSMEFNKLISGLMIYMSHSQRSLQCAEPYRQWILFTFLLMHGVMAWEPYICHWFFVRRINYSLCRGLVMWVDLLCWVYSYPEENVEQTVESLKIWDVATHVASIQWIKFVIMFYMILYGFRLISVFFYAEE